MAARKQSQEKRYAPLGRYLANLPPSTTEVALTLAQVRDIVGRRLPDSAYEHRVWCANQEYGSRSYHWQDAGFRTGPVSMSRETVRFSRVATPPPPPRRPLTLQQVITEVNEGAHVHRIGGLQDSRKENKRLTRNCINQSLL